MTTQRNWRKVRELGSRPECWLMALLLWALASACRSLGTPWAAAAGTEALRWAAGIGLALALGGGLRRTETAGQLAVLLLGAMALIGILSGGNGQGDLTGPYQDHQLYGSALLLLLPFSAAAALSARSASWRWGALASLTAGVLCLFLSETRSAWFGLLAAGLVFGGLRGKLLLARQGVSVKDFFRQRAALLSPVLLSLGLLLGLLAIWLLSSPPDQKTALCARAATLLALSRDESWQTRLLLWRGTAHLVAAHPLAGIGLGRYPGAEWGWTHAGGPLLPPERPSLTNEAHSFYGQTAAEIGLPGLALYGAALAAFIVQAARRLVPRRRRAFGRQNALPVAVLSALAGQSVDALASPSWQFSEASLLFWGVLGLGLASLRGEQASAEDEVPLPASLRRAGRWALAGGLAVALAAQLLPTGLLLMPVEAYSAPAGWKLNSVAVLALASPTGTITPGTPLRFLFTATYKDSRGSSINVDVSADAKYSASLKYATKTFTVVNFTGGSSYTVPSVVPAGTGTLGITSYFQDAGTGQITYAPGLTLAVAPQ